MTQEKDYLTTKELAARWGLRPNTLEIYRHRKKGCPYYVFGNSVRYKLETVIAYEQAITTSEGL